MKAALLQLTSSDDPGENLEMLRAMLEDAAGQGAKFVLTPEVTNCVSTSRTHQAEVLQLPTDNTFLRGVQDAAATLGIWVLLGSLAIKTDDPDGRFANRCFVIAPDGSVRAEYDKIHMFDVDIDAEESYRKSAGYRPGTRAVVAQTDFAQLGLSICYDMRFPTLYRALAGAGAQILTVPAAFSPVTGAAHWHSLLRARFIEPGCYLLSPSQPGAHPLTSGKPPSSHRHSRAVSPRRAGLLASGPIPGVSL